MSTFFDKLVITVNSFLDGMQEEMAKPRNYPHDFPRALNHMPTHMHDQFQAMDMHDQAHAQAIQAHAQAMNMHDQAHAQAIQVHHDQMAHTANHVDHSSHMGGMNGM